MTKNLDNPVYWFEILVAAEREGQSLRFYEAFGELEKMGIIVRFTENAQCLNAS